jgi:hypothetical protein
MRALKANQLSATFNENSKSYLVKLTTAKGEKFEWVEEKCRFPGDQRQKLSCNQQKEQINNHPSIV